MPVECFHASPLRHKASIETHGLQNGRDAGESTSGRDDAKSFIYFSLTEGDCRNWVDVFKAHQRNHSYKIEEDWLIIKINTNGINAMAFHDPISGGGTGYFFRTKCILPEQLTISLATHLPA